MNVSMESAGNTNWFKVTLTAGMTYKFTATGLDGVDLLDVLTPADASDFAHTYSTTSGAGQTTNLNFTADTSGVYYFEVGSYDSITGPYTIGVTTGTNSYTLANVANHVLTIGGTVNATMESAGNANWFKVTLTAGSTYRFTETGLDNDDYFDVLPPADASDFAQVYSPSSFAAGQSKYVNFTADTSGVYYVKVGSYDSFTGAYTIGVAQVTNSYTLANVANNLLYIGGTIHATMENSGITNWFKVTLTAGATYRFTESGLDNYVYFNVLTPADASDSAQTYSTSPLAGGQTENLNFTADTSGVYYFEVASYGTITGAYTISVAQVTNSYALANVANHPLSIGGTINATMESAGNTNWFEVTLTAGATYRFTETGLDNYDNLNVLTPAASSDIEQTYSASSVVAGQTKYANFTADTSGVYYLEVSSFDSFTGAYTIGVNTVTNSYTLANVGNHALTIGGTVNATMESAGNTNWFKVTLTAGATYRFTETGLDNYDNVNVLTPATASDIAQTPFTSSAGGQTTNLNFTADTSGVYYFEVSSYSGFTGAYTISVAQVTNSYTLSNVSGHVLSTGSSINVAATHDFDGNGVSDLLLQNGGSVIDWVVGNGVALSGKVVGNPGAYSVVSSGDFNGDGISDLLLQNGSSVVDWIMKNGLAIAGNVVGNAGSYTVRGVGDFNGDGVSDVLLQNGGFVVDWIMQNGVAVAGNLVGNAGAYSIVAEGDFNGDGTSDIMLQNGASIVEWNLQNGVAVSGSVVGNAAGYSVVGAGDFNGDGFADILLQSGGTIIDWIIHNGVATAGNLLATGLTGWTVVGTGDYNGDGISDIALQNGATVVDWAMSNGVVANGNVIGNAGAYSVRA